MSCMGAANEELVNELIEVIWPVLDGGMSVDEVRAAVTNVIGAWEPPGDDLR